MSGATHATRRDALSVRKFLEIGQSMTLTDQELLDARDNMTTRKLTLVGMAHQTGQQQAHAPNRNAQPGVRTKYLQTSAVSSHCPCTATAPSTLSKVFLADPPLHPQQYHRRNSGC
jgi:hypothetical protein